MQRIYKSRSVPGRHKKIEGDGLLDKVINIDQSPSVARPLSNPATYTGVWIRCAIGAICYWPRERPSYFGVATATPKRAAADASRRS